MRLLSLLLLLLTETVDSTALALALALLPVLLYVSSAHPFVASFSFCQLERLDLGAEDEISSNPNYKSRASISI